MTQALEMTMMKRVVMKMANDNILKKWDLNKLEYICTKEIYYTNLEIKTYQKNYDKFLEKAKESYIEGKIDLSKRYAGVCERYQKQIDFKQKELCALVYVADWARSEISGFKPPMPPRHPHPSPYEPKFPEPDKFGELNKAAKELANHSQTESYNNLETDRIFAEIVANVECEKHARA